MRAIQADDYRVGDYVTVLQGPFELIPLPVPHKQLGFEHPPRREKTNLHGRIFTLAAYDPPFIILVPVEGAVEAPENSQAGLFAGLVGVPGVGPKAIHLRTDTLTLATVDPAYVAAYKEHFCPCPVREQAMQLQVRHMQACEDFKAMVEQENEDAEGE